MKKMVSALFAVGMSMHASIVLAEMTPEVEQLQARWAEVNYLVHGKSQIEAFSTLIEQARQVTTAQPQSAEAWAWSGIIRASYAAAKGGLGALSSSKAAKSDFEKALDIESDVLEGSVYTSLGTLYLNVPGWPMAFGDDVEGAQLLKQGLKLSPQGMDSNYFYAQYLFKDKEYDKARRHLNSALEAAPRSGREIAEEGRRAEIQHLLEEIEEQE